MSAIGAQAPAHPPSSPPPPPPPPSNNTYPEIVRIRYLEGDVRVSRGEAIAKETGADWEQATTDLELETGFSLATGAGRAEIELEDESTIYLDENSALTLDDLHTTAGQPDTELTLLAGTLTLRTHPNIAGGLLLIKTPTDSLRTTWPDKAYLRINSFLDAVGVTLLKDDAVQVTGAATPQIGIGKTVFYRDGEVVPSEGPDDPAAYADFDRWVANRAALRSAALKSVSAASGLNASVPGLADMYGQGTFFACKPYGTCWEPPADPADSDPSDPQEPVPPPQLAAASGPDFALSLSATSVSVYAGDKPSIKVSVVTLSGFTSPIQITATPPDVITCVGVCTGQIAPGQTLPLQFAVANSAAAGMYTVAFDAVSSGLSHRATLNIYVVAQAADDSVPFVFPVNSGPIFPCYPPGLHPLTRIDPVTGRLIVIHHGLPYAWAVCHTGAWIFRSNVYVWVPTRRRHHHRPVHWVKSKKLTGYVPLHPRDVSGKPPVNRKHEVYTPTDKKGGTIQRTKFDPKDKIDMMKDPPKEFRAPYVPVLKRVDQPEVAAHDLKEGLGAKAGGTKVVFDPTSHGFVIARDKIDGEKHTTVRESFEEHTAHSVSLRTHGGGVETRSQTKVRMSTPKAGHTGTAGHAGKAGGGSHAGGGGHAGGGHAGGGSHAGGSHH